MSVITEEKENSKVLPAVEDLEYKIEIATQILDRYCLDHIRGTSCNHSHE